MNQKGTAAQKIVITGLGAVTPIGNGVDAFWQNLVKGKHGFGAITIFDPQKHRTDVAAEVDRLPEFEPQRLDKKLLSRSDLMQLVAVQEALVQAKLFASDTGAAISPAMGVINATAAGGILGLEEFFKIDACGQEILLHNGGKIGGYVSAIGRCPLIDFCEQFTDRGSLCSQHIVDQLIEFGVQIGQFVETGFVARY